MTRYFALPISVIVIAQKNIVPVELQHAQGTLNFTNEEIVDLHIILASKRPVVFLSLDPIPEVEQIIALLIPLVELRQDHVQN